MTNAARRARKKENARRGAVNRPVREIVDLVDYVQTTDEMLGVRNRILARFSEQLTVEEREELGLAYK